MNIEWYGTDQCSWCKKTNELFENNKNKINAVKKHPSKAKVPLQGIPFIINKDNGKTTSGFPGSMKKLLKQLS